MQKQPRKIPIQNCIKFLANQQSTGVLSVEIPSYKLDTSQVSFINYNSKILDNYVFSNPNSQWKRIFFCHGKITHAFEESQYNLARLKDYLTYYQLQSKIEDYIASYQNSDYTKMEEYKCLIWLLQQKYLKPLQLKTILLNLIEETIFDIFVYQTGNVTFQVDDHLNPIFHSRSTISTICKLDSQFEQWKQFTPHILSPHQLLELEDRAYLKNTVSSRTYDCLNSWADDKKSLLQLSRQLNCSLIYIGKALYPYIHQGLVTLKTDNQLSLTQNLAN